MYTEIYIIPDSSYTVCVRVYTRYGVDSYLVLSKVYVLYLMIEDKPISII